MSPDEPDATARSRPSRRRLLRAGGAAAAGLASSSAGCVATLPPLGRRVRYGRVDLPDPTPPSYPRWLPVPGAFPDAEDPAADDRVEGFLYVEPGNLGADRLGESFAFPRLVLKTSVDHLGVGWASYHSLVRYGPVTVVRADIDPAAVADTLDRTGYTPAGSYLGRDLYARDDVPRALAVGDGGFVFATGERGLAAVRAVLDAAAGAAPRAHERDDDLRRLVSAVGERPFVHVADGGTDPWLVHASAFDHDDDGVYHPWYRLYPEGETPSEAAVKRELDDEGRPRRALDVEVVVDGRLVTIEQRQSHDRFRSRNDDAVVPPQVTWGIDHDRGAGTATVRHEIGERVPADQLSLGFRPKVEDGDAPAIETQFADRHDTVGPGDAVTVDVSDWPTEGPFETALQVRWHGPKGTMSVLLEYER